MGAHSVQRGIHACLLPWATSATGFALASCCGSSDTPGHQRLHALTRVGTSSRRRGTWLHHPPLISIRPRLPLTRYSTRVLLTAGEPASTICLLALCAHVSNLALIYENHAGCPRGSVSEIIAKRSSSLKATLEMIQGTFSPPRGPFVLSLVQLQWSSTQRCY